MKTIPIALQSHLDEDATTLCQLVRVETKDGTVMGFTDLDADVVYDDGDGAVTYVAENGFTPSRHQASADMAVDNAELSGVVQSSGITEAQIRAGLFDYARVKVYRVNYMNLANGHEILASGTAGETHFSASGWKTEFRSLTQQLKQPISNLYSLTCREKFGSMPIGTPGEQPTSRTPCGKVWTWVPGSVTSVGANPRLTFTDASLTAGSGVYDGGVVRVLTGNNAGEEMEVESYDSATKTITLALPLAYPMAPADTYEVREDCSKIHDDAEHGCVHHWGADWPLHLRGEPLTPVSDGGSNMAPGAQITRA